MWQRPTAIAGVQPCHCSCICQPSTKPGRHCQFDGRQRPAYQSEPYSIWGMRDSVAGIYFTQQGCHSATLNACRHVMAMPPAVGLSQDQFPSKNFLYYFICKQDILVSFVVCFRPFVPAKHKHTDTTVHITFLICEHEWPS